MTKKNYDEMNEASFSKLTSDKKYIAKFICPLCGDGLRSREKIGDILRAQKKTSHNDRIPFFFLFFSQKKSDFFSVLARVCVN